MPNEGQNIIRPQVLSFEDIREDLIRYARSLPGFESWKDWLESSDSMIIVEWLAGLGAFIAYNQMISQREASLDHARQISSVFELAANKGLLVPPSIAPELEVEFTNTQDVSVDEGEFLGVIGDYNVYSLESKTFPSSTENTRFYPIKFTDGRGLPHIKNLDVENFFSATEKDTESIYFPHVDLKVTAISGGVATVYESQQVSQRVSIVANLDRARDVPTKIFCRLEGYNSASKDGLPGVGGIANYSSSLGFDRRYVLPAGTMASESSISAGLNVVGYWYWEGGGGSVWTPLTDFYFRVANTSDVLPHLKEGDHFTIYVSEHKWADYIVGADAYATPQGAIRIEKCLLVENGFESPLLAEGASFVLYFNLRDDLQDKWARTTGTNRLFGTTSLVSNGGITAPSPGVTSLVNYIYDVTFRHYLMPSPFDPDNPPTGVDRDVWWTNGDFSTSWPTGTGSSGTDPITIQILDIAHLSLKERKTNHVVTLYVSDAIWANYKLTEDATSVHEDVGDVVTIKLTPVEYDNNGVMTHEAKGSPNFSSTNGDMALYFGSRAETDIAKLSGGLTNNYLELTIPSGSTSATGDINYTPKLDENEDSIKYLRLSGDAELVKVNPVTIPLIDDTKVATKVEIFVDKVAVFPEQGKYKVSIGALLDGFYLEDFGDSIVIDITGDNNFGTHRVTIDEGDTSGFITQTEFSFDEDGAFNQTITLTGSFVGSNLPASVQNLSLESTSFNIIVDEGESTVERFTSISNISRSYLYTPLAGDYHVLRVIFDKNIASSPFTINSSDQHGLNPYVALVETTGLESLNRTKKSLPVSRIRVVGQSVYFDIRRDAVLARASLGVTALDEFDEIILKEFDPSPLRLAVGNIIEKVVSISTANYQEIVFDYVNRFIGRKLEKLVFGNSIDSGEEVYLRSDITYDTDKIKQSILRRVVPNGVRMYTGNGILGWKPSSDGTLIYRCLTFASNVSAQLEGDLSLSNPSINVVNSETSILPGFDPDIESIRSTARYYPADGNIVKSEHYEAVILKFYSSVVHDVFAEYVSVDDNPDLYYEQIYVLKKDGFGDDGSTQEINRLQNIKELVNNRRLTGIDLIFTPIAEDDDDRGKTFFSVLDVPRGRLTAGLNGRVNEYLRSKLYKFQREDKTISEYDIALELSSVFGVTMTPVGGGTGSTVSVIEKDFFKQFSVVLNEVGLGIDRLISLRGQGGLIPLSAYLSDTSPVIGVAVKCFISGGVGAASYQWQRDGVSISGATESSYTPVAGDIVSGESNILRCKVTRGDAIIFATATVATTHPLTARLVNEDTPTVELSGSPVVGTTLVCQPRRGALTTDVLTSADDGVLFQWQLDGVNVAGATSKTYEVVASNAGAILRCRISHRDDVIYAVGATAVVLPLMARLSDTTPIIGSTLTCLVTGGIGDISFLWEADGVAISGATSSMYTVSGGDPNDPADTGDLGKTLSCRVIKGGETIYARTTDVVAVALSARLSDTTPIVGDTITCNVIGGHGVLTFQWQRGKLPDLLCIVTVNTPIVGTAITLTGGDSYEWKANGIPVMDGASATYTPVAPDVADGVILTCEVTINTPVQGTAIILTSTHTDTDYQWRRNTDIIDGATSATYTPVAADVSYVYVNIQGSASLARSYVVVGTDENRLLRCQVMRGEDGPVYATAISETVADLVATLSSTSPAIGDTITCTALGGSGTISYQWRRTTSSNVTTDISMATSNNYVVVPADDNHRLSCYVERGGDNATTALTDIVSSRITVALDDYTPIVGQILTCTVTGGPSNVQATFQWQRDGVDITNADSNIYTVQAEDVGTRIRCVVVKGGDPAYATATADVGAALSASLSDPTPVIGQVVTCMATGGEGTGPAYQWQRQNNSNAWVNIGSATASTYTPIEADDLNRLLRCQVTRGTSTVHAVAIGVVTQPLSASLSDSTPSLSQIITCNVIGGSGSITYQWQRDGVDISDATDAMYTVRSQDVSTTLRCIVVRGNETIIVSATNRVTLALSGRMVGTDGEDDSTPVVGERIQIGKFGGSGLESFQWQNRENNIWTDISGATSFLYTPVEADAGKRLRCVYTRGDDTIYITATADTISSLSASLSDTSPSVGQTITCNVSGGSGVGPTYQWRRNGVDIAGAMGSSYIVTIDDLGSILSCRVVRGEFTVFATASVGAAVSLSASFSIQTPFVGEEVYCLFVGGSGDVSFQWKKDGVNILNAINSSYTPVENDENSILSCVVTRGDEQVIAAFTEEVFNNMEFLLWSGDVTTSSITLNGIDLSEYDEIILYYNYLEKSEGIPYGLLDIQSSPSANNAIRVIGTKNHVSLQSSIYVSRTGNNIINHTATSVQMITGRKYRN